MVQKKIFVLDTNVFIHAANVEGYSADPSKVYNARNTYRFIVATCYPLLFSQETLDELLYQFKKIKAENRKLEYDIINFFSNEIMFNKTKRRGKKYHKFNPDAKKDDSEKFIRDPSDRKFIYLLRDYNFRGEKYLITEDRNAFQPKDKTKRTQLEEYSQRYGFRILRTRTFIREIQAN